MTSSEHVGPRNRRAKPQQNQISKLYPLWFHLPGGLVYITLFLIPTGLSFYFAFTRWTLLAASGVTGLIPEESITPLTDVERLADVRVDPARAREALAQTVMIKLNGGLGTSMGMDRAKTLLPVREGKTFLDLIVAQVQGIGVPGSAENLAASDRPYG